MLDQTKATPTPKQEGELKKVEPQPIAAMDMTEAPYSWTRKAVDENGFEDLFTVRAVTHDGFTKRVENLQKYLLEHKYKPSPRRGGGDVSAVATENGEVAPVCPYHKVPMVRRQGKNGTFWSCHNKIEGTDQWCQYTPPKK